MCSFRGQLYNCTLYTYVHIYLLYMYSVAKTQHNSYLISCTHIWRVWAVSRDTTLAYFLSLNVFDFHFKLRMHDSVNCSIWWNFVEHCRKFQYDVFASNVLFFEYVSFDHGHRKLSIPFNLMLFLSFSVSLKFEW